MESDELIKRCNDEIDGLASKIESVALEVGLSIAPGPIRDIIEGAIEDLHIEKFIKQKFRKARRWTERKIKKLKKKLKIRW